MTSNPSALAQTSKDSDEYARLYYQHQYERLAKIEDQTLTITNIVMTISTGALAFGFSDLSKLTIINGIGLPLMIIFSNLFAIAYILRSRDFMKVHIARAKQVLELYAGNIFQLDKSLSWPEGGMRNNRIVIQVSLHLLLMLTSLLPVYAFLRKVE